MKKLFLFWLLMVGVAMCAKLPIVEPYTYNGIPTAYDSVRRIVYNFNATTVLSNLVTSDGDSIYREELTVDSCGTYKVNLTFYGNSQRLMVAREIVSNCYGKAFGNPMIVDLDAATGTLADAQVDNITVTAGTVSDKTGYGLASTQTFNMTGNITGNLSGSVGSLTTNNDKTGYALSGTQVFNNTGTWAGNITGSLSGSVGSVSGAVGSVTGLTAITLHSDLDDIQTRLPASLNGGRMNSNVDAMTNNVITAAAIQDAAIDSNTFALDARKMIAIRSDSGNALNLTAQNIQDIVDGVVAAGVAIDTAVFRANLVASLAATPLIVGTNNDKASYQLATDAITAAVIAASGAHEIAQASDSGGIQAVDYNIIASTAYDYFTAGSREDPFKGGAGAGPDTTLIYVLSATDSTPIVGASVSYFVGATKLATNTDSTGLVVFGATAGTYTTIAEAKPRYMSTVSVTAGTTDTIYMTQPTIPDPVDTNLTGAYGYIYNLAGDPVAGAVISVKAQKGNLQVGNLIVSQYEVYDTTDAAGFWSMNLYPSPTLGDTLTATNYNTPVTSTRYTFTQYRGSQQIIRKANIVVPDTASWQFDF